MGFNFLKATKPQRGDSLLFTTQSTRVPGARPPKDERLGCPWSCPKVLNLGIQRLNHSVITLFRKESKELKVTLST